MPRPPAPRIGSPPHVYALIHSHNYSPPTPVNVLIPATPASRETYPPVGRQNRNGWGYIYLFKHTCERSHLRLNYGCWWNTWFCVRHRMRMGSAHQEIREMSAPTANIKTHGGLDDLGPTRAVREKPPAVLVTVLRVSALVPCFVQIPRKSNTLLYVSGYQLQDDL